MRTRDRQPYRQTHTHTHRRTDRQTNKKMMRNGEKGKVGETEKIRFSDEDIHTIRNEK